MTGPGEYVPDVTDFIDSLDASIASLSGPVFATNGLPPPGNLWRLRTLGMDGSSINQLIDELARSLPRGSRHELMARMGEDKVMSNLADLNDLIAKLS